jgi:2-polyprenyl-3-methyl-5-hydroxy-6-metoxy-1,4-benzoquinol methylase
VTLKETYDKAAIHDRWESIYRTDPIQDKLNDEIMERMMHYAKPSRGGLFLDAGCGIGDHSIRIAKRGFRCIGADISEFILKEAKENARKAGLESKISFVCQALEELAFLNDQFDVVHCRGVLMHVPEWEKALAQLCQVLKPGGSILITELNHTSLETALVQIARRFRKSASKLTMTAGGLEFWSEQEGKPFVARTANVAVLIRELGKNRLRKIRRFATEFWDVNRFPSGILRRAAIRFNRCWFRLHLPAYPSSGNGLIAGGGVRDPI